MSHSLNSLKGVTHGNIWGTSIGVMKGDTRSSNPKPYTVVVFKGDPWGLDYISYKP